MNLREIHQATWWEVGNPKGICYLFRDKDWKLVADNATPISSVVECKYEWILDIADKHIEGLEFKCESHHLQTKGTDRAILITILDFRTTWNWLMPKHTTGMVIHAADRYTADEAVLSLRVNGYLLDTWVLHDVSYEKRENISSLRFTNWEREPGRLQGIFKYSAKKACIQGHFLTHAGIHEEVYDACNMTAVEIALAIEHFCKQYQEFFIAKVRHAKSIVNP